MNVSKLLKQAGLKNTKQRQAVLEVLMTQVQPINAETCYSLLKQHQHTINLSTIYRTLEQFTQLGLIEKSYSSLSAGHVYAFEHGHHRHYMICTSCHTMVALESCPMHQLLDEVEASTGFHIQTHSLEIQGVCQACQAQS
jgi:Fur family ferric uptake transcriptional regulator